MRIWGRRFSLSTIVKLSIHAPLAGRDQAGGRVQRLFTSISIHAPLAGRDAFFVPAASGALYFNPRAPCGARHRYPDEVAKDFVISIHAPLAGRDGHAYS